MSLTALERPSTLDAPAAYWEGDKAVFRSSAIGGCPKSLVALLMGVEPTPPPQWQQDIFDLGHELEPYIIRAASAKTGYAIEGSQTLVEFDVAGRACVRSHLDGLAFEPVPDGYEHEAPGQNLNPSHIVEAKGLGKTYMAAHERDELFEALPQYAWQISVQMHELDLPVLYCVFDKRGLTAGDVADLPLDELIDRLHVDVITEPPISKGEIRKKCLDLLYQANQGELPEFCALKDAFCSTPFLHDEEDDDALADFLDEVAGDRDIEAEEQEAINALARTYQKANTAAKRAKEAKKQARDKLQARLEELGVKSIDTGACKVTRVDNRGRKKTDWKALNQFLKEHGKSADDFKYRGDGYSYPRITIREDTA